MALFVPIFDILMAVCRRRMNGKKIFSADKNHLHHCLLNRGYSHPKTVRIIWGISAIFGAVSVALSELIFKQVYLALALLLVVVVWAIYSAYGVADSYDCATDFLRRQCRVESEVAKALDHHFGAPKF